MKNQSASHVPALRTPSRSSSGFRCPPARPPGPCKERAEETICFAALLDVGRDKSRPEDEVAGH